MYKVIDLFAGAGGLSIGLEKAGFKHILLNEIDKDAISTLTVNRPKWNILKEDIKNIDFNIYKNNIDLLTGGIPCQPFSHAGNRLGFKDTRGTLFYEFGRALTEIKPKMFMIENVKGLKTHDFGRTLETMLNVFEELEYHLYEPKVLNSIYFKVPQKRERLFIIGIRKDLYNGIEFSWPKENKKTYTVGDALKKGELYNEDVPLSKGQGYSQKKLKVMSLVPEGKNWRSLPEEIQKEYMMKTYYSSGGRTGIAKRLSFSEPSPTILCSPSQKQTERCHPIENRPITIRESARIQTFPDNWQFEGSIASQYRQIGNAIPINLGYSVSKAIASFLKSLSI